MRPIRFLVLGFCGFLVAAPVGAATSCEGVCEDESGAVRTVDAGLCRSGETCRAGCDATPPGPPRPYAECVSTSTGRARVPESVVPLDVRRE